MAKDARAWRRAPSKAASETNTIFAPEIDRANETALKALNLSSGDTTKVASGPFKGMRYNFTSRGSLLGPKLLGTYESEITSWVQDIITSDIDTIVDVGCAEGYYAVGFPYAKSDVQVYAFDADPEAQALTKRLSKINGVSDRVLVDGFCGHERLQELVSNAQRALVLVDIEGSENDLLDPVITPALNRAEIVVELHEHLRPGVTTRVLERFSYSHCIDVACTRSDACNVSSAATRSISPEIAAVAVPEGRCLPQLWLRLRPLKSTPPCA